MREEEKAENEHTVSEAEAGLEAVSEAIQILDRFYKTAAKENVFMDFIQKGPMDDAPDAGFDNGGGDSDYGSFLQDCGQRECFHGFHPEGPHGRCAGCRFRQWRRRFRLWIVFTRLRPKRMFSWISSR